MCTAFLALPKLSISARCAGAKDVDQRVDNPDNAFVDIGTENMVEQRAQKRVRFRHKGRGLLAERNLRACHRAGARQTGRMQSSANTYIGELLFVHVVNENFLKRLKLFSERTLLGFVFAHQRAVDHIAHQLCFMRHHLRQLFCALDRLAFEGKKFADCLLSFRSIALEHDLALLYSSKNDGVYLFTVAKEAKLR